MRVEINEWHKRWADGQECQKDRSDGQEWKLTNGTRDERMEIYKQLT